VYVILEMRFYVLRGNSDLAPLATETLELGVDNQAKAVQIWVICNLGNKTKQLRTDNLKV